MTPEQILEIFTNTSGYLQGHFKLSSGLHSKGYMQCALVLQNPVYAEQFGKAIAEMYKDTEINCVVGPAMGGIIIAHEVARALGKPMIFSERKDGEMTLRRGFAVKPGTKILIVEDVITTGKSILEVARLLKSQGADIIGFASIIDRSSADIDFGTIEYKSLAKIEIETFSQEECPLCSQGMGIDSPGSRFV